MSRDREIGTALMLAAGGGHTEIVEALLASGADMNARYKNGRTSLMFAEECGYTEIVEVLKQAGAKGGIMDVEQAKDLIFKRLCEEYKKHGDSARVYWRDLPEQLNIPYDIFKEAVKELCGLHDNALPSDILFRKVKPDENDPDYIKLTRNGVDRCMGRDE